MTNLRSIYRARRDAVLTPLARRIEEQLQEYFREEPRIDRIQARAKDVGRFVAKALKQEDGKPKYDEPLHQIQDQLGVRVVTFYLSDVERVRDIITKYYRPIETKLHVPESVWEFGYFGHHFVLITPADLIDSNWDRAQIPAFFELQIKTLFQHAWSEANHDLGYKPGGRPLSADAKRRMAFTSAQAWGADQIFNELFKGEGEPVR
jgi:putative GTP pyrophosphokinase